jgi:hypothetical protein
MVPLDYVLAVAVLSLPPGPGEVAPKVGRLPGLEPTLRALAVGWEVLDPREARHVLAKAEDLDADVQFLRRRYQNLIDAPPLGDCQRFPDRGLVCDLLAFNQEYQRHLTRLEAGGAACRDELREAMRETDQLYHVWDLLRDARSDCYYVSVRRQALLELREAVGVEAYYSGQLPPHVPVWRFGRLD